MRISIEAVEVASPPETAPLCEDGISSEPVAQSDFGEIFPPPEEDTPSELIALPETATIAWEEMADTAAGAPGLPSIADFAAPSPPNER